MNFYNFATVQILLCAITTVHAHSHVECTKFNGQQCQGYARFYWYNKQGFEGTDQSRDRNYIVSAGLQNCPAAPAAGDPYNSDYPMATVSPGEMVELQWPPRGHLKQPNSDVWIYCSNQPGVQQPVTHDNSTMPLVGTMSYGNCTGSDISWARCYGSIRIPHDWAAGEVRTCQWVWKLTEQMYVDCFDYRVVAGDDSPKDSDQPKVKSISVPIEETDNNLPVISDTYAPGASGRQLNCAE